MRHDHAQSLGELTARVGQESDHGPLNTLVSRPSLHDGAVVDAVHKDFIDARGLESSLLLKVPGHLGVGSGGGKGPRQADDDLQASHDRQGYESH